MQANHSKKIYVRPTVEELQLEPAVLMASSPVQTHDEYNRNIDACEQLSNKRESIWDSME
ncbi:unknown [Prevotella sp. CAG:891]|nr:unknown [Prevotella sp. CAG:891]